ncbi:MAG: DUF6377 domain-containing protein [Prevotella sp.]|jgi:hypothetical protein
MSISGKSHVCMHLLLLFIFLFVASESNADEQAVKLNKQFERLDVAISNASKYRAKRVSIINNLKEAIAEEKNPQILYDFYLRLAEEYKPYMSDSSLLYLDRANSLALKMQDKQKASLCHIKAAYLYATIGMLHESTVELGKVDTVGLTGNNLREYYVSYEHVYHEFFLYTGMPKLKNKYNDIAKHYLDLVLSSYSPKSEGYLTFMDYYYCHNNKADSALAMNNMRLKRTSVDSRQYAYVTLSRFQDYALKGDTTRAVYWLTESAISDVQHGVCDQASIWFLAQYLQHKGDMERANRYINYGWNCAQVFGTKVRNWQIIPVLFSTDIAYKSKLISANFHLQLVVVLVSILLVLLFLAFFRIARQKKMLAETHSKLKEANDKLISSNNQLTNLNSELEKTLRLYDEANKAKEEYIGIFFAKCSTYINKLDDFRKSILRKLNAGEQAKVLKELKNTDLKKVNMEDLFQNFDSAFLKLYPTFVRDLNKLLQPDSQLSVDGKGNLTLPLRIYALIRLGIDNSGKISEFLQCSANTVYNYRSRVKMSALDTAHFEENVKSIGNLR